MTPKVVKRQSKGASEMGLPFDTITDDVTVEISLISYE